MRQHALGGFGAVHAQGDHAAEAVRLAAAERVGGMLRQPGVEHLFDVGIPLERFGDGQRVLMHALHAQGERLDAAQHEPAVKRREHAAGRLAGQADGVAQLPRRRDDEAADRVVVAGEILAAAVDDEVRAQRQRALEDRREERVVHDQQRAGLMRQRRAGADIGHVHHRVARRLQVDRLCLRAQGGLDVGDFRRVGKLDRHAVLAADVVQVARRAAVEILAANDVIAGPEELEYRRDGRHA